jgi:hypothetical protein
MSGDREDLWARQVSGEELPPPEQAELLDSLSADPAFETQLLRDEELDGLLRALGREQRDAAGFVREFKDRVAAAGDADRFAGQVRRKLQGFPRRRLILAAAAALVLALGGGLLLLREEKTPPIARIDDVQGEVLRWPDRQPVAAGEELHQGQGLETSGPGSKAVLMFPDRTRIELGSQAVLKNIEEGDQGKRLVLDQGSLKARVSKQLAGRPLVFSTPHGEATVVGTILRLVVDKGTRLDVDEGKVRLKNKAGNSVEVVEGRYAVAAADVPLASKSAKPSRGAELVRGMAPDSWLAAPDTPMRIVTPVEGQFEGTWGTQGPAAVITAWSGAALDSGRNRLVLFGGGHTDYFGNELYAFDIDELKWNRLTDPTVKPTLDSDVNWDGTPNSRDTYNGLAYLAHSDRFFALGGSIARNGNTVCQNTWTFDFASHRWTNRNPGGTKPVTGYGDLCSYDPVTRKLWWCSAGIFSYDDDANRWVQHGSTGAKRATSCIDTKRGMVVIVGSGKVHAFDLRSGNYTLQTWTTTGGDDFIAKESPGLDYDPVSDRIIGWHGGAPYILDPVRKVWTVGASAGAPPDVKQGIYGRWRYVSGIDAFVVVTGIDHNVHFYKPGR